MTAAAQRLVDYFAEIESCLTSVQGALRHYQQPQDVHFHMALKACRDGTDLAGNGRRGKEAASADCVATPQSTSNIKGGELADLIARLRVDGKWAMEVPNGSDRLASAGDTMIEAATALSLTASDVEAEREACAKALQELIPNYAPDGWGHAALEQGIRAIRSRVG